MNHDKPNDHAISSLASLTYTVPKLDFNWGERERAMSVWWWDNLGICITKA